MATIAARLLCSALALSSLAWRSLFAASVLARSARLRASSGIPGQAQTLQGSLLGILNEVEQTIGGNFDQQIQLQETQVSTLLNLETIGEQQLAVLTQIASNIGNGTTGGGQIEFTPDILSQIRIGLARQRRNGAEVF